MPIQFRREEITTTFLDPGTGFSPATHHMEFRYDPLTQRRVRLAHMGAISPLPLDLSSYENAGFCPFCPSHRENVTPKFLPEFLPQGRLAQGEALLVPNISPYDQYSALVIMSQGHILPLEDLTITRLTDSLDLACWLLSAIREKEKGLLYEYLGWNYMPPSGGALIHPHLQVLAGHTPPDPSELEGALDFIKRTARGYYQAYVEKEIQIGERYLGHVGEGHWLSAFAPFGVLGEYMCVFPSVYSVKDFTPEHRRDFASGLQKLFQFFKAEGIFSFNVAFLFGPPDQKFYPVHMRIIPRTFLNTKECAGDANMLQMLLQNPLCTIWPEDTCKRAKPFFL